MEANNKKEGGMTLRDWFAGQIVSGFSTDDLSAAEQARRAREIYAMAEALVSERQRLEDLGPVPLCESELARREIDRARRELDEGVAHTESNR